MRRRLLRDGVIVEDTWERLQDGQPPPPDVALIVTLERWMHEKPVFESRPGLLGIELSAAHKVEDLVPDLGRLTLVAANFPGPSDGRGYTQGRLLRERYGFNGELRASGYVRFDQLFFLARCGFNAFELAENELDGATRAFKSFSAAYQASNDRGLPAPLPLR